MRPRLDEVRLREELRLASRASRDWRYALRSKKLASLCARLIKRDISGKTLLEVVDRRGGLIQRHLGRYVNWFLTVFGIAHFWFPFGASRPS
jgi:hypothetical protein